MNPDNMKEYNELLWLMVKKNKRDSVRGQKSTRYVDPGHVCFIELTNMLDDPTDRDYVCFIGEDVGGIKVPELSTGHEQTMHCSTEYLKKIVDNIRADDVLLMVSDDYPLLLAWRDGEDQWRAIIAPRVENE